MSLNELLKQGNLAIGSGSFAGPAWSNIYVSSVHTNSLAFGTGPSGSLSDYQEYTNASASFSGPFSIALTGTIQIVKVGKMVSCQLPNFTGAIGGNSLIYTSIPVRFAPIQSVVSSYTPVISTSNAQQGNVQVYSDGSMHLGVGQVPGAGNFSGTTSYAGIVGTSLSWSCN